MASHYEAVEIGETDSFGSYEVTREEILSFGNQYDPQPFHVDPEAAAESMFGELVASGWHTAAMTMRMLVDNYLLESGAMGSPGVEQLRWRVPVRPGDVLSVETEVVDKEPWDDERGVVRSETETVNGDGDTVMEMTSMVLYPRASADS
jgi:acyl dehydratase